MIIWIIIAVMLVIGFIVACTFVADAWPATPRRTP